MGAMPFSRTASGRRGREPVWNRILIREFAPARAKAQPNAPTNILEMPRRHTLSGDDLEIPAFLRNR